MANKPATPRDGDGDGDALDLLPNRAAWEYVKARLPPGLAPTWKTWVSWAKPSHTDRRGPRPLRHPNQRLFWRRRELDRWIRDRIGDLA